MENISKGTLSESRDGSTTKNTTTDPTIKITTTAVAPDPNLEKPQEAPTAILVKEPAPSSPEKPIKESCTLCKAKSIANLAFSFSLVILVLAFSFSLVKRPK